MGSRYFANRELIICRQLATYQKHVVDIDRYNELYLTGYVCQRIALDLPIILMIREMKRFPSNVQDFFVHFCHMFIQVA